MSAIGSALLGLTVLVCASACSDSTDPGGPSELAAVSPLTSTGVAGEPVSPPPSVIVTDSRGRPVTGVVVAFTVEGGGSISTPEDTTNTSGVAAIQRWVLGPAVGTNRVTASVPGLEPVIFTATGNAGAPASMEKVSGDNQTTISGSPVPAAPTVLIRDINGNPVSGVAVSFTVAPGDIAVLTGGEQTTNESGLAAVGSWRPGGRQALYTLRAAAGNLSVAFRATVVFGPASTLSLVSGNNQTGRTGFDLNRHLEVIARDVNGNPSPGIPVVFTVTSGGGRVVNGTQTTNFEGAAALSQWILGPPGPQTVAATISGIPLVIFNAFATPPVPDGLAFDLQDPSLDTSAGTSNRVDPPIYDLLAARGEFIRDTLVMSFTFNVPVAPFTLSPHPTGLDFQISIDTTGTASTHNPNFGVGPFSGPTFSSSHAGNTMTVRVPMPRLAGDDGNLSIVGLFRSADGVVDRFPNQGALLVTRPSGVAANRR